MAGKAKSILTPSSGENLQQEIEQLRQRWEAESESRLFFPLAKAYCEVGEYAEAARLCEEGLQRYPQYWSARVVLAQAYLGQQLEDEALAELELVVHKVTNNLLASKLLGEIYTKQGRIADAIQRYQTIFNYYPECMDLEEALFELEEELTYYKKMLQVLEEWLVQIKDYRLHHCGLTKY